MKRIAVVGTSGSGKTTLSKTLAVRLGLTHIELDALHWQANWTPTEAEPLREKVETALDEAGDGWIIDGNYSTVRPLIFERADTVVWLDYPLIVPLFRVLRRSFRRLIFRETLWNGNRERGEALWGRDSLVLWVLTTHKRRRKTYTDLHADPTYAPLAWVHLRSPRETARFLARLSPDR